MSDPIEEATPDELEPADELEVLEDPDVDLSAREWLRKYLEPALPKRWQQVWSETASTDVDVTRLRLTQTSVARHPTGPGTHLVTFTATVTVPSGDLDRAEAILDDELEVLLYAIDALGITWTEAAKDNYGGRLGYRFTLTVSTYRKAR